MPYDDPSLKEFDNYYQAKSASLRERAENWAVAIGLHGLIFEGVFPHAGFVREVNLRKREWVLRGDSVTYGHAPTIEKTLEHDFDREREYSYSGKSKMAIVAHFARFIAGIWQIHPFREGNTRATAVFAIKYLKSMRIKATNDLFAEHSWFFRNALVRANYENPLKDIARDFEPLERFFRNLILGEKNELKNRYLIVGISDAEKATVGKGGKTAAKKRSEKSGQKKVVRKSGQKTVDRLLELLRKHPHLTQAGMVNALMVTRSTVQKHLSNLKSAGKLRRVGPDKGGHWEVIG